MKRSLLVTGATLLGIFFLFFSASLSYCANVDIRLAAEEVLGFKSAPPAQKPETPEATQSVPRKPIIKSSKLPSQQLKVECYIDSAQKTLVKLAPTSLLPLLDAEDAAIANALLAINVDDIYIFYEQSKDSLVAAGRLPANSGLSERVKDGVSLAELAQALGIYDKLPESARQNMDQTRSVPTQTAGVSFLDGGYLAVANDTILIIGDNLEQVVTAKDRFQQAGALFAVPEKEQIWIKASDQIKELGRPDMPFEQWFGLRAVPAGWFMSAGSNSDQFFPWFTPMQPLNLANMPLYTENKPDILFSIGGKLLEAFQNLIAAVSGDTTLKSIGIALNTIDNVTISLGGLQTNVMGLEVGGPSICISGPSPVLAVLMQLIKANISANWTEVPIKDWQATFVSTQNKINGSPVPITLMMALKNNSLLITMTQPGNYMLESSSIAQYLNSVSESGVDIPLSNIIGLVTLDIQKLWHDAAQLLERGSFLRMMSQIDQKYDQATIAAFDHLRQLTPPIHSILTWVNASSPTSSQGYIIINNQDGDEFTKTLVELLKRLN